MMERITQSMLASTSVYNVQANLNRMAEINESMTSGKRMKFASSDPASSVDSMRLRKHLAATEQYKRNINDASSWLQTANTAMQTVSAKYSEAKDSLIRANSGAQGKESLGAIAADLRQQAAALMNQANTTYLGRTVFAGNSDKGAVFTTRTYEDPNTHTTKRIFEQTEQDAVTAQNVNRQINANQVVAANVDGNKLFGTGSINWNTDGTIDDTNNPNVMNLLISAAEMLESGNVDQSKMEAIQGQLEKRSSQLYTAMSDLGARHKVVLENQLSVETDLVNISSQISGVEDIDIQKSTIELSLADMAYKASLGATQRVVQPTLLDYLR